MEYRYSICVLNFNFSSFILDEFVSKSTNFREVFKEWRQENEEDFYIYYTIENEETEEFAIIKVHNDGSNESDDDFDVMNIDEFKELIWNDMRQSKEYKNYKAKFYEIKKTNPKTITFEFDEKRNYNYDEVKNKLEEIRKLDYFSIARNSGKCRREVRNFLEINNDELIKALKTANGGTKVLIVDDIVTTGSTIKEILRKIKPINDKLDISLLSFIGKKGIGHG